MTTGIVSFDFTCNLPLPTLTGYRFLSLSLVPAYAKSSSIAQQTTNCLTDLFIDEAMDRAKWLDAEYDRTGSVVRPMHGVVVSIQGKLHKVFHLRL